MARRLQKGERYVKTRGYWRGGRFIKGYIRIIKVKPKPCKHKPKKKAKKKAKKKPKYKRPQETWVDKARYVLGMICAEVDNPCRTRVAHSADGAHQAELVIGLIGRSREERLASAIEACIAIRQSQLVETLEGTWVSVGFEIRSGMRGSPDLTKRGSRAFTHPMRTEYAPEALFTAEQVAEAISVKKGMLENIRVRIIKQHGRKAPNREDFR